MDCRRNRCHRHDQAEDDGFRCPHLSSRIPGLDQIKFNGSLNIGPMVTHRAIEKSEIIRKNFSALADAVDYLGSVQIRNVATIGGNICTAAPSADKSLPFWLSEPRSGSRAARKREPFPWRSSLKGRGRLY